MHTVKISGEKEDMAWLWGYEPHNGPCVWGEHFSIEKEGKRQSPIDIITANVEVGSAGPFFFNDPWHDHGNGWKVTNSGRTVAVAVPHGFEFSGGDLPAGDHYMTDHFHFHWGSEDSTGSEHLIDGSAYPIEMHIVTYDIVHGSMKAALDKEDGLAVLGFFFQLTDEDNEALEPLIKVMEQVAEPGSTGVVDDMHLMSLIEPVVHGKYWRYPGSLTTPPLHESKVWSVMQEPLKMSHKQMGMFRKMKANGGVPMSGNFRPVQPLHDRVIIQH